jgi:hypothetical protein
VFLPNAYALKRLADYETGNSEITKERAKKAVAQAAVDRLRIDIQTAHNH